MYYVYDDVTKMQLKQNIKKSLIQKQGGKYGLNRVLPGEFIFNSAMSYSHHKRCTTNIIYWCMYLFGNHIGCDCESQLYNYYMHSAMINITSVA